MNHYSEPSKEGLAANTWNASFSFGTKVEMEDCKAFIEKTYANAMKSLEHVPYTENTKHLQQDYGDWKLTLRSKQVYWIESKARARDTEDLCVEVRLLDGKHRLKHLYTDKLYYNSPNNAEMLIDVPLLRELIYQNDDWQQYVRKNRNDDKYCMYIPFKVLIPAYHKMLGMLLCPVN